MVGFSAVLVTWTRSDMKIITGCKYIRNITYKMYKLQINNMLILTIVKELIYDTCYLVD